MVSSMWDANIVLRIERDEGMGRALVFLHEERTAVPQVALERLSARSRLIHLVTKDVTPKNWESISNAVSEVFEKKELRQVSFVCLEHASVVALHRSLDEGKFVRSLILYHPISSPHPNFLTRVSNALEKRLPLGLPLRTLQPGFHAPSFLHRVRCPTVILLRNNADNYISEQSCNLAKSIPTAWLVRMNEKDDLDANISTIIEQMSEIPVKCPQKARK